MRKTFPGYYHPNAKELLQLWKDCLFVLDANILLNIYRYTPKTRDIFIDILKIISDRLWIPYQSAVEYQQNRLDVINQQLIAYENVQHNLKKSKNQMKNELKSFSKHPFIDVKKFYEKIESTFSEINEELEKEKEKHPNLLDNDELRETITTILEGKVGSALSQEELKKIYVLGKERYENKIPPGYEDKNKDGVKKFGDLVLWCQIINYIKTKKQPVILVIDDKKDDWWLKFNGKIISPRPELINEMFFNAGVKFYMYQSSQFMEYAQKYLESHITPESIEEVRDIEKTMTTTKQGLENIYFDEHLLRVGETLILDEGWAITLLEIDVMGNKAWISLTITGEEVINKVVPVGEHFTYYLDDGQNKTEIVDFIVETVFAGVNISIAKICNLKFLGASE